MKNKLFLKFILEQEVDVSDEFYQKDFEGLNYKVNWDVCGAIGYQIYEQNKYSHKIGESFEDPDATLSFLTMEFVKQLMRGKKILTRIRRSEGGYHLCRYDPFISTRTTTKDVNAQILIAKIPFFRWVVPSFGASRTSKPLQSVEPIEIKSSRTVEKEEIEALVKSMLSESVDVEDEEYKKDFKDQVLIVNWEIGKISAYQKFEESSYNYEYGKLHDKANLTLEIDNLKFAKRFFRKDTTNFAPGLDTDDNFVIYVANPVVKIQFKDPNTYSFILSKLPFTRAIYQRRPITEQKEERENFGGYISVNIPLGEFENIVVPYQVFERFINKASNIILRTCPCRERGNCQDHAIELGCIFMGDDTLNMAISEEQAYVATKEQALEHTRKAIENGLIPLIGRNVEEAEGAGVKDTGHFLSCCFCCPCCCVAAKAAEYATSAYRGSGMGMVKKLEGLEIKTDSAKCVGCGECVEVCIPKAREIIEGKSSLNSDFCVGCGRCVDSCPNGALSIEIVDPNYIDEFISRLESIVDVEKQDTKIDA